MISIFCQVNPPTQNADKKDCTTVWQKIIIYLPVWLLYILHSSHKAEKPCSALWFCFWGWKNMEFTLHFHGFSTQNLSVLLNILGVIIYYHKAHTQCTVCNRYFWKSKSTWSEVVIATPLGFPEEKLLFTWARSTKCLKEIVFEFLC